MKTTRDFQSMKKKGEQIVMCTAYDYPSGLFAERAEVDVVLVGDSLGMVVLGYDGTLQVTIDDIAHHTKAARRGAKDTFIVADMPYRSYHISNEETKRNAFRLIVEGGANAVKLEGGSSSRLDAIKQIVDCEIPVCAHLGLTPQSVNRFGGYRVQGKDEVSFDRILAQAKAIEDAGAFMLVLEGIPEKLGRLASEALTIPTIGIGAGRFTDGQVLVYHDLLGMSDMRPKFVRQYAELDVTIEKSLRQFTKDVREREFPGIEHVYYPENES